MDLRMDMKEKFMEEALKEAEMGLQRDEVPVGCVIVYKHKVIAKAYNQTNLLKDPTAHAEMIAITQAADYLKHERLLETELYSTIEPCVMCLGAMIHARIPKVYYGAPNEKYGACGSVVDLLKDGKWNHTIEIEKDLLRDKASDLMQYFFRKMPSPHLFCPDRFSQKVARADRGCSVLQG